MVGHQTVSVNRTTKLAFAYNQVCPVIVVVVITDKNGLPVMTSLNDMMGRVGQNYP